MRVRVKICVIQMLCIIFLCIQSLTWKDRHEHSNYNTLLCSTHTQKKVLFINYALVKTISFFLDCFIIATIRADVSFGKTDEPSAKSQNASFKKIKSKTVIFVYKTSRNIF